MPIDELQNRASIEVITPVAARIGSRLLYYQLAWLRQRFGHDSLTCPTVQPKMLAKCQSPCLSSDRPYRITASSKD